MTRTKHYCLIRFVSGPRRGRYHLQVDRDNQWGFALIAEDGFESAGGLDFRNCSWVVSRRKWPRWAIDLVEEMTS